MTTVCGGVPRSTAVHPVTSVSRRRRRSTIASAGQNLPPRHEAVARPVFRATCARSRAPGVSAVRGRRRFRFHPRRREHGDVTDSEAAGTVLRPLRPRAHRPPRAHAPTTSARVRARYRPSRHYPVVIVVVVVLYSVQRALCCTPSPSGPPAASLLPYVRRSRVKPSKVERVYTRPARNDSTVY